LKRWIERPVQLESSNENDNLMQVESHDDKAPSPNETSDDDTFVETQEMEVEGPLVVVDPTQTYIPTLEELQKLDQNKSLPTRTLRSKNNKNNEIDPLIGKRIKVKWPQGYFYGTIVRSCTTAKDRVKGTHIVRYEDDNKEYFEKLNVVKYEVVSCMLARGIPRVPRSEENLLEGMM